MKKKKRLCLALDSTSDVTSVACLSDEGACAVLQESCMRGQGEALMGLIQQVLDKMQIKPTDLTQIAVAVGPGSFTGVRIGLATARGLGLALNIPVMGVDNFTATAHHHKKAVKVVLDSKRSDFFVQDFSADGVALSQPAIQNIKQLERALPFVACGSGASQLADQIPCKVMALQQPLAVAVAEIALFQPEKTIKAHPIYLREADVTL